jgi:SAM-dependent methyltransferase
MAKHIGYNDQELSTVPEGANLGLGCGNPVAIAGLKPGETVLDLGSGAGFDAFLAARQVGLDGKVVGLDMTDEMLFKAQQNAARGGFVNVEFVKGKIEEIPLEDGSVDVIISNCVINLSPEKSSVFDEAFRVLKPGGRLEVSDIIATAELPEEVRNDMASVSSCIGGAALESDVSDMLGSAGFEEIRIERKAESREIMKAWGLDDEIAGKVVSAYIRAVKPA